MSRNPIARHQWKSNKAKVIPDKRRELLDKATAGEMGSYEDDDARYNGVRHIIPNTELVILPGTPDEQKLEPWDVNMAHCFRRGEVPPPLVGCETCGAVYGHAPFCQLLRDSRALAEMMRKHAERELHRPAVMLDDGTIMLWHEFERHKQLEADLCKFGRPRA